ncbi:Crp/Fnr family transcriptional regulator [Paractinoplanes atraurantiacus]|uniref:cAMP-binding domain of CRP or a regulatory subunit of cAMP-dependent protein kinases n=1 Tax=Paractinoplanes atraurantiacus TaxID=1036182 RepID=A0A285GLF1_9ACTN|nr:Crp/Fnr family transcriptional regulator [Actinoplanes atraurantiacus]SNY24399.1 cAMP-binding domain of CRP or a regulatory subunit of cAMP-dependent protein kinases [Actinoplanes atraurantiacus]
MLSGRLEQYTQIRFPKNAHVYNCGARDDYIYLVESGQVKTVTYSRDGKKCLLSIYAAGDVFGELCLLSAGRVETATTMRTAMLRRIPLASFRAALGDQELLDTFLRYLTLRLAEQQQIITNLVTMDSERRLAAALLILANKLGKRQARGIRIEQRITQEELSGMVGTTRSRVGYFLKRFCEAGLVYRTPDSFLVVVERNVVNYLEATL